MEKKGSLLPNRKLPKSFFFFGAYWITDQNYQLESWNTCLWYLFSVNASTTTIAPKNAAFFDKLTETTPYSLKMETLTTIHKSQICKTFNTTKKQKNGIHRPKKRKIYQNPKPFFLSRLEEEPATKSSEA